MPSASRRNLVRHLRPGDGLKLAVALHAAREWRDGTRQVKAADRLRELEPGSGLAHEIPVRDRTPLEQAPVPGQDDPALARGELRERRVIQARVADGVEAEHAQVGGQPGQMRVGGKPRTPQRPGADPGHGRDIERLENGVHAHPVAVPDDPVKPAGVPVDENEVNLGVRHAQRLDEVLHRLRAGERVTEGSPTLLGRQEVIQLGVEAEMRHFHGRNHDSAEAAGFSTEGPYGRPLPAANSSLPQPCHAVPPLPQETTPLRTAAQFTLGSGLKVSLLIFEAIHL